MTDPETSSTVLGYPDVVLAGAARCGTSFLAARLSAHPGIDGCSIKEPNYFSRHADQDDSWYDGLYEPRSPGLLRLDSSMSYTTPQYPDALAEVARANPDARIIYAVRDPLARAVSHYRLLKNYLSKEDEQDFGHAIASNPVYLATGDYERWLGAITDLWGVDRLLVVPFDVTTQGDAATDAAFAFLGLDPLRLAPEAGTVQRNQVVEFKSAWMRPARRALHRSQVYPWLRRRLGPDGVRRLRGLATRTPHELSVSEALASCSVEQRGEIAALVRRSGTSAGAVLEAQDARLGLDWARGWRESVETASQLHQL